MRGDLLNERLRQVLDFSRLLKKTNLRGVAHRCTMYSTLRTCFEGIALHCRGLQ